MFPIYPPIIKGNTISNLILVDAYDYEKSGLKGSEFGFALEHNTRDVFLNVNSITWTDKECFKQSISTIVHEVTHNVLAKHIGEISSVQLDNLFDIKKYEDELKWKLFKLKPSKKIQKNSKKKVYPLKDDFWLSPTNCEKL